MSTQTRATEADKLAAKIRATEDKTSQTLAADRARLDELREQEAKAARETQERVSARKKEREKLWASDYLNNHYSTERATQATAERAARTALREVLTEQPWVQALIRWQETLDEAPAVETRANYARSILGRQQQHVGMPVLAIDKLDGQVRLDRLADALYRVVESRDIPNPLEGPTAAIEAEDGPSDPLSGAAETMAAQAQRAKSDPLARLSADSARIDKSEHRVDGRTVIVHTNRDTGEWVHTTPEGRVVGTSWAATPRAPQAPVDGTQYGSVLDAESGKYRKVRVN